MTKEVFEKYVVGEHRPIRIILEKVASNAKELSMIDDEQRAGVGKIVFDRYVPAKNKWQQISYEFSRMDNTVSINYWISYWTGTYRKEMNFYGRRQKFTLDQIELAYTDEELKKLYPYWCARDHEEDRSWTPVYN